MNVRRALLAPLLALVCATGCASATSQGQSRQGRGNQLTRTELAAANTDNLYDAITKLRPEWLSSRGPTSVSDATPTSVDIFMNGSMLGKADYLRQVGILDVSEVKYWDAGSASARFGMGHPRGVIEITRK
jgi:hypothetical protein